MRGWEWKLVTKHTVFRLKYSDLFIVSLTYDVEGKFLDAINIIIIFS